MGAIKKILYKRLGNDVHSFEDQIDLLEVMAELMGYCVESGVDEQYNYRIYFFKDKRIAFTMTIRLFVNFTISCQTVYAKMALLKMQGEVKEIVELRDGLEIAQKLL
jgi:hypothetical protein